MSTHAAQAKLKEATEVLNAKWRRTREYWQDDSAEAFKNEVIEPFPGKVRTAMEAMGRIGEMLAAAKRDCSPS
ncbi:MAG: hypothetical protein ACREJO_00555 [Phycisphaerales bacterium]